MALKLAIVCGALALALAGSVLVAADRADADADANADANAAVNRNERNEWEQITAIGGLAVHTAANAGSDGNMHWLREMYLHHFNTGSQAGVLVVGPGGMPPAGAVAGFPLNPAANPLFTHTTAADVAGLSEIGRALLTAPALAARWAGFPDPPTPLNVVPSLPGLRGVNRLANCHATVIAALKQYGATRTVRGNAIEVALRQMLQPLGYEEDNDRFCDVSIPLTRAKAAAATVDAGRVAWNRHLPALRDHYVRFQALLPAQNLDIWELRGWLYATDRANGHRLVGAIGWADGPGGPAHDGDDTWEGFFVKRLQDGGPNARTFGLPHDTIGHVRPRMFGGNRDPLNFVPQSEVGQKIVGMAEEVAEKLAAQCVHPRTGLVIPTSVRYYVIFQYPAAAGPAAHQLPLRPSGARSGVDLTKPCTAPAHYRLTGNPTNDVFTHTGSTF